MKIVNLNGDKIKACFSFVQGNCEISVSTIFNEDNPVVAVFDKGNGALLQDSFYTIGSAISWVDSFGPRD
jgi:hypothetical protein